MTWVGASSAGWLQVARLESPPDGLRQMKPGFDVEVPYRTLEKE
jgi:hypothetical protein